MIRYRPYAIFLGLVLAGLAAFFLASEGYYPVLLVGDRFVSARRFSRGYDAASTYYRNLVETYDPGAPAEEKLKPEDIQLSVLEQLVENVLVAEEAERRVGNEFSALVRSKVQKFGDDPELEKAAAVLYGLHYRDFEDFVLVPQAEREILAGRLFLEGEKLEAWLEEAKKSARVVMFSSAFKWKEGKMEVLE
ncbi:hypothetical protein C4587_02095 [Candidatus Parcubacteria bacterium]|nr:MAG: hypothetical protein C4587_02095 [Candidatus Parcubacteria bacterium]